MLFCSTTLTLANEDPELTVLKDFNDEISLVPSRLKGYQLALTRFRTALHNALRIELFSQLLPSQNIPVFGSRLDLLNTLADEIYAKREYNYLINNIPFVPADKRFKLNERLNRFKNIERVRLERLTSLFEELPPVSVDRLETKLLDYFVKTLSDLISERTERSQITAILGMIAVSSDLEISSIFSDVDIFLKALHTGHEFKTQLRIIALRALASIRSPWAYFWISQCIGEHEPTGGASPVAREAIRLMTHDDTYATTGVFDIERVTGFYTYEKWVGLSFTVDYFEESALTLYLQGIEDRGPLLNFFKDKLERAVLRGRKAKQLSTEGFISKDSDDEINLKLKPVRTSMRRTLHRESLLDPGLLISFIAAGDARINLYTDISVHYGPAVTLHAQIRNRLQIPPEESVYLWAKRSLVGRAPCEESF